MSFIILQSAALQHRLRRLGPDGLLTAKHDPRRVVHSLLWDPLRYHYLLPARVSQVAISERAS